METAAINRIKAVLAEQFKTSKWLAEQLDLSETTVSLWCTNKKQPSVDRLREIARILKVDVRILLHSTKSK